jgi:hypothetical protein
MDQVFKDYQPNKPAKFRTPPQKVKLPKLVNEKIFVDHIQQIEWSAIEDGKPAKIVIYLGESKVIVVLTLELEN